MPRTTVTREQIRDALLSGLSRDAVTERLGVSRPHVDRVAQRFTPEHPELRGEPHRPTPPVVVPIPAWATRAGLDQDYRDWTRAHGEYAAARVCRRLAAEARRDTLPSPTPGPRAGAME